MFSRHFWKLNFTSQQVRQFVKNSVADILPPSKQLPNSFIHFSIQVERTCQYLFIWSSYVGRCLDPFNDTKFHVMLFYCQLSQSCVGKGVGISYDDHAPLRPCQRNIQSFRLLQESNIVRIIVPVKSSKLLLNNSGKGSIFLEQKFLGQNFFWLEYFFDKTFFGPNYFT